MKRIFSLALILSCLSLTTSVFANVSAPKQDEKLVVFFVHGFLGSSALFCDLKDVLHTIFDKQIEVFEIEYSTRGLEHVDKDHPANRDNVSTPYFISEITKNIQNIYTKHNIAPQTNYAVVAHSQGGPIFLRFLQDCIYNESKHCYSNGNLNYPKNLKYLFTIGSPFGGSTIASKYKNIQPFKWFLPEQQIKDLSVGSQIINTHRENILQVLKQQKFNPYKTKVINIAANAEDHWLSELIRYISFNYGLDSLESDMAVNVPAARLDFLYSDKRKGRDSALETNIVDQFYALRGNHMNVYFTPASGFACVKWDNFFGTPLFAILHKNFSEYFGLKPINYPLLSEDGRDIFSPDITSFQLEVKMNLVSKNLDLKDLEIRLQTKPSPKLQLLKRKNDLLNSFSGFNTDTIKNGYITYYTHGAFKADYAYNVDRDQFKLSSEEHSEEIKVEIYYKNKLNTEFSAVVKPSKLSIVEINI